MTKGPALHPDYLEAPVLLARDDFWGQVRRTVGGKPVGEDQISMIVGAVVAGLDLSPEDVVLDLACGNGALTARLPACSGALGVDYSGYLISVAKEYFARPPGLDFVCQDVASFVWQCPHPGRFTKVLCYGSFSYLTPEDCESVLRGVSKRFTAVSRVFLGNLPDRDQARDFYKDGAPDLDTMTSPTSPIGIWRSEDEISSLAKDCGWSATFYRMPDGYYARHYRYDAVLIKASSQPA